MRLIRAALCAAALLCGAHVAYAQEDSDPGTDAFNNGDYGAAFQAWEGKAGQGDPDAMTKLGTLYEIGYGTKRDFSKAEGGSAAFFVPSALSATGFKDEPGVLRLITIRSNDQFNTTVYGYDDRFRGIKGTREVLMMNTADIRRYGLSDGGEVSLECAADDGVRREKRRLRVVSYDIPEGCVAGYYPELNVLIPLEHHARESKVPAAKAIPVRILDEARPLTEGRSFAASH